MPTTDPELAGGCLCGAVRYRLAGTTHEFSAATLDTPEAVTLAAHVHDDSRIAWPEAADGLPRCPRGRHG